jgi:hypothetical protein
LHGVAALTKVIKNQVAYQFFSVAKCVTLQLGLSCFALVERHACTRCANACSGQSNQACSGRQTAACFGYGGEWTLPTWWGQPAAAKVVANMSVLSSELGTPSALHCMALVCVHAGHLLGVCIPAFVGHALTPRKPLCAALHYTLPNNSQ